MAARATGTFKIDNWDENEILQTESGSKITNAKVSRSFDGDLEGEGSVEWLMGYSEDGTATFVGLERVVGRIGDKTGTFVLQHVGTFDGQVSKAQLTVVPGSGTGDFAGLRGEGSFEAGLGPEGERSIKLDLEV
jgi:Protein of unknown function (DUF3224)